jgi:hypothetical protein
MKMDIQGIFRLPEDDWICCGNHAGDCESSPENAAKVEAVMMLARMTTDAEGLAVPFRLPPAVAVAIVHAFESGDPALYVNSRLRQRKAAA